MIDIALTTEFAITAAGAARRDAAAAGRQSQAPGTPGMLSRPHRPWPFPVGRATGRELRAVGRVIIVGAPEDRAGRPAAAFLGVVVTGPPAGGSGSA
jgi:hypothetical protein